MANQAPASLRADFNEYTLAEAYEYLQIKDTSIADGDVVLAFWTTNRPRKHQALEVISNHRRSQLLAFVLTIVPHLTWDKIALLATQPALPDPAGSLSTEDKVEEKNQLHLDAFNNSESHAQHSNIPTATAIPSSPGTAGSKVVMTPSNSSDVDIVIHPEDSGSVYSEKTSSTEISLGDEDSTDSDFDELIGDKFWNGHSWRCEQCNDELVHGRCPNGDAIYPCRSCGQDSGPSACSRLCAECHNGLPEQCAKCSQTGYHNEQGSNEEAKMIWDDEDGIWRCTACLWEVEANSEEEGECHCIVDPDQTSPESDYLTENPAPKLHQASASYTAERIELLYYHEYEPADSDSSGSESIDSEPDSEDEAFIDDDDDDDEPFDHGLLTLLAPPNPPDEHKETEGSNSLEDGNSLAASHDPDTA